jgi:hypothetical protein
MEVFTAEKLSTERNSLPYPADSLKAGQTNLVLLGGGGHHADRELQVLSNLTDNGIKFTPPEGSIVVNASMVEGKSASRVWLRFAAVFISNKDFVLPVTGNVGFSETWFVAACTNLAGAEIMMKRIREQLVAGASFKAAGGLKVSASAVPLPAREEGKPFGRVGAGRGRSSYRDVQVGTRLETIPESANGDVTAIKNKPEQIRPDQD